MILHGNSRGGARDLALHLLKDENDHVTVHELRGFVSDNLLGAFDEVRAICRGTKAKQYLFSLSLNPPPNEQASTHAFENAIEEAEKRLGLSNQPRAIVFHEKNGRRHCHTVWSRIDGQKMKAIPLPHTKRKLTELSRELYFEHGWTMPDGFLNKDKRRSDNFTMAEWQQAKRTRQHPSQIKSLLKDCWASSNSQQQLTQRLKDYGYTLSQGSRRAIVVMDRYCEVYSLPRWLNLKTKAVKEKVKDFEQLPRFEDTKAKIATTMQQQLDTLNRQRQHAVGGRIASLQSDIEKLNQRHKQSRQQLDAQQAQRQQQETQERQQRFNKGIRGLWDRLTGKHTKIRQQNERDTQRAQQRDQAEKDQLIFQQLEKRQALQQRIDRLQTFDQRKEHDLNQDRAQYQQIIEGRQNSFEPIRSRD